MRLEYEQVVVQLEKDTVNYSIDSGTYMDCPETLRIKFQVEPEKYEATIKWFRVFLWESIFDPKRLAVTVAKMISDIPDEKRAGKQVGQTIVSQIFPNKVTNIRLDESVGQQYDLLLP